MAFCQAMWTENLGACGWRGKPWIYVKLGEPKLTLHRAQLKIYPIWEKISLGTFLINSEREKENLLLIQRHKQTGERLMGNFNHMYVLPHVGKEAESIQVSNTEKLSHKICMRSWFCTIKNLKVCSGNTFETTPRQFLLLVSFFLLLYFLLSHPEKWVSPEKSRPCRKWVHKLQSYKPHE